MTLAGWIFLRHSRYTQKVFKKLL